MTTALSVRLIRDVITARGADTRSFLHSQLSNDIMSMPAGASRYSFVLEPTGKLVRYCACTALLTITSCSMSTKVVANMPSRD